MRYFNNDDLVELVLTECGERSQKRFAEEKQISPSYLSDFLNGRRDAGPGLLLALGFEITPYYRKAK